MSPPFWYLYPPRLKGLAEEARDTDYEQLVCPIYDGHTGSGKRIGSLSVIVHPARIYDFTFLWSGGGPLVLPKVLDLFEKYRVTGFEAERVRAAYPKAIKGRPLNCLNSLSPDGAGSRHLQLA